MTWSLARSLTVVGIFIGHALCDWSEQHSRDWNDHQHSRDWNDQHSRGYQSYPYQDVNNPDQHSRGYQPVPYPDSNNPDPYMYRPGINPSEPKDYWRRVGDDEIQNAFRRPINWQYARNVIVMVCDGMDPNTVTASRIFKETERGKLAFERFPHIGLLKTYSVNKKVPDSAAAGTALFTGVKTNNELVGVDARVGREDCMASLNPESRVSSIMEWASEQGKNTGLVTNKRVTESMASALYAHSASKFWECNSNVPEGSMCKDIGRQLVEDDPGRSLKVIFGGGRQTLQANPQYSRADNLDLFVCQRSDNRDLVEEWSREKHQKGSKSTVISSTEQLMEIDTNRVEYALGLFANSHLPYEIDRNKSMRGVPSLEMMVEPAIKILRKHRHAGFVLMVQSGLVDKAHHEGNARRAIEETLEFEKAVLRVQQVLWDLGIVNETLVIVTGGHGHTLSINGYPDRNASILGIADRSKHDNVAYTTLTYATGSQVNYQYNRKDNYVFRDDPSKTDTLGREYHQQAAILTDKETHGGGDVTVYATGPFAHMFYGIHEQTYVANVIAFAAKIGPYRNSAVRHVPTMLAVLCSILALGRRSIM